MNKNTPKPMSHGTSGAGPVAASVPPEPEPDAAGESPVLTDVAELELPFVGVVED